MIIKLYPSRYRNCDRLQGKENGRKENILLAKQKVKIIVVVSLFLSIYLITVFFFRNYYVFEWTARHHYLYLWLLGIFLTYTEKDDYAVVLSIANIVGIIIGQFLGDYLRAQNMMKITEQLDNETIYRLSNHDGVLIWIAIIVISMVIFSIVKNLKNFK